MRAYRACPTVFVLSSLCLSADPAFSAEEINTLYAGLQMLWGLLIVLALILILYFLLRKKVSLFHQQGKGLIKILEVKHLMARKSLILIEVRGQEYLVGCGNDSINTIIPLQHGSSFATVLKQTEDNRNPNHE